MSAMRLPTWRDDDDARLEGLENGRALRALESRLGIALPPGAAGLFAALRETEEGCAAIDGADASGDYTAVVNLLSAVELPLTPRLAHHLALLFEALARAQAPSAPAMAEQSGVLALARWFYLAQEGAYLTALAESVVGSGLPRDETHRLAADVGQARLEALGAVASAGAESLARDARVALAVLSRAGEAIGMAGRAAGRPLDDALAKRLLATARRVRSAAIDRALLRIDGAFEDAMLRNAPTDELRPLLHDLIAVWRFSDRDDLVERHAVRRITPPIWDRYRDKRWDEIRSLLTPLEPLIEHMGTRVEGDPAQVAYAAPCAQMFVFRAEVAHGFEEQLRLAERALVLCDTHRNGRLVLADLLTERAVRALSSRTPWTSNDAIEDAKRDLRRAQALYPQLKRLEAALQQLAALGHRLEES